MIQVVRRSIVDVYNQYNFTRQSLAYDSKGRLYHLHNARFEPGRFGKAVMVEEGTQNLVSNGSFETLQGGQTPWGDFTITASTDTTTKVYGNASQKHVVTGTTGGTPCYSFSNIAVSAGTQYSISVSLKGDQTIPPHPYLIYVRFYDSSGAQISEKGYNTLPLSTSWQRHIATVVAPSGAVKMRVQCYVYQTVTLWADGLLVEAKPYATSFIDGTRSPETLTIPTAGVLNPQEGTVEFWVYVPPSGRWSVAGQASTIFWAGSNSTGVVPNQIYADLVDQGFLRLVIYDNNGNYKLIKTTSAITSGWHSLAYKWDSSGPLAIFVDGVKQTTTTAGSGTGVCSSVERFTLGFNGYDNARQINALIDDLRISSRARTDEEIAAAYASNAPLPVDADTTLKLDFDGPDTQRAAKVLVV